MYEDIELDAELKALFANLRELHRRIRDHRWGKFRRLDPFVETLFERTEKGRYLCGKDVVLHDSTIVNGNVDIGEHTHISQQCTLDGSGGLTIGRYCSVAAGTRIMTHDSSKWAVSGGKIGHDRSPVTIEDFCFIGANCVITRGVRIGRHSVIGAGAVVTRDIPPLTVAVGVPARAVGRVILDAEGVRYEYDAHRDPGRIL